MSRISKHLHKTHNYCDWAYLSTTGLHVCECVWMRVISLGRFKCFKSSPNCSKYVLKRLAEQLTRLFSKCLCGNVKQWFWPPKMNTQMRPMTLSLYAHTRSYSKRSLFQSYGIHLFSVYTRNTPVILSKVFRNYLWHTKASYKDDRNFDYLTSFAQFYHLIFLWTNPKPARFFFNSKFILSFSRK